MSDDLVKRLRDWSEYDEGKINDAREEAADRIQALEAALRDVVDRLVTAFPPLEKYNPIQKARAALGEKHDE